MSLTRPVIDIHTHIMPPDWDDLGKKYGAPEWPRVRPEADGQAMIMLGDRKFRRVTEQCFSPPRRLADMDAEGIRRQLISPIPVHFCYEGAPAATAEFARIQNDFIAETLSRHPDRFLGAGTVAMQSVKHALPELERMRTAGFRALEIGTNVGGRDLDDPEIVDILEAAQSLGLAVFVHPWSGIGEERMRAFYLPHMVGLPAETSLAISRLIFGGVLDRLPRLRLCFAHGGGAFPGTIGRIEQGFLGRPDLCAVDNKVNPRDYVKRIYVDSLVHDRAVFKLLLDILGPEGIAFGSDYPFPLGEKEPGKLIESMTDLDAKAKERVFSGTAREWLGL